MVFCLMAAFYPSAWANCLKSKLHLVATFTFNLAHLWLNLNEIVCRAVGMLLDLSLNSDLDLDLDLNLWIWIRIWIWIAADSTARKPPSCQWESRANATDVLPGWLTRSATCEKRATSLVACQLVVGRPVLWVPLFVCLPVCLPARRAQYQLVFIGFCKSQDFSERSGEKSASR